MSNTFPRRDPLAESGPAIVTRARALPGSSEVLSVEELAVADRVARRLHNDLRALFDALPSDARHASGMARALGIDRTTCQRAVFAASRGYAGPELLTRLPGVKGLRQLVASGRAALGAGSKDVFDALDASIRQFQSLITTLGGSQSRLIRRLEVSALVREGDTGDSRGAATAGPRQRLFHAAAELTGRSSDCWVAVYLYNPSREVEGAVELIRANGLLGHRARADAVPLVFHSFATKPRESQATERRLGLVEPLVSSRRTNAPDSLLGEFSSDPHPFVSTAQPNEFCVQSIDETAGAGHGPIDLMFATRTMIAHPAREQPPVEEAWALVNFPCRRLLFDVYMHRGLAGPRQPALDAHLWRPDFAQHVGSRWQTRFAEAPSLQFLPPGLRASASDAWARHSELTRFLFERSGLDASEFVGFRCDADHPVWRAGYCMSFDFAAEGEEEGAGDA